MWEKETVRHWSSGIIWDTIDILMALAVPLFEPPGPPWFD